jgi:isopenicillin N synthase-like dioxygenase
MQYLSKMLMEVVISTLTADKTIVSKCFADGGDTSFCRLNYYPICPAPEANLGVGPHSDAGILTILYQHGNVNSLQVQKDGKFYDVPPVPSI